MMVTVASIPTPLHPNQSRRLYSVLLHTYRCDLKNTTQIPQRKCGWGRSRLEANFTMAMTTSSCTSERKGRTLRINILMANPIQLTSKNNRTKSHTGQMGVVALSMRNIRDSYTRDRRSIEGRSTGPMVNCGSKLADGHIGRTTIAAKRRNVLSSVQPVAGSSGCPVVSGITNILFPPVGVLRWRDVVSRSQSRPSGKFPSLKMGRMLQWESRNELNVFRLLDCDSQIGTFTEQPCKIEYTICGVSTYHVPDILVDIDGRKELWEVKPNSEATQPEIAARTAFMSRHLPIWGYVYRVVLADDLLSQPRLGNANRLLQFGRDHVTECEHEFVRRTLKQSGRLMWSSACDGDYGARGRQILCRMVIDGVLSIDLNQIWSAKTQFVAGKRGF